MTEVAHTPTRVTGTVDVNGTDVTFDYVGCVVCPRVMHSLLGEVAVPWERAHPDPLPATATTPIPDSSDVRR